MAQSSGKQSGAVVAYVSEVCATLHLSRDALWPLDAWTFSRISFSDRAIYRKIRVEYFFGRCSQTDASKASATDLIARGQGVERMRRVETADVADGGSRSPFSLGMTRRRSRSRESESGRCC
jgi:hypothetical protein